MAVDEVNQPVTSADLYRPECSVIIPTRDRPELLEMCLQAVIRQSYPVSEIIVVDSAPRVASARELAARFGARYLCTNRKGLSLARNLGAGAARGQVLMFVDDDAVPATDCLAGLVAEFRDDRVMAVSGRTLTPPADDPATLAFEGYGGFDPGDERRVVDQRTPKWFELVNFGGVGIGAIMAFRREAFSVWPGFDERLGRGALQDCSEELYAWFSLVDRGWRVVYSPASVAMHPGPPSLKELRKRHLRDAAWAAAYMSLLLCEHPRHRGRVLRYAIQAVVGTRREWRRRPASARHSVTPRWLERIAWMTGPLLYARMRVLVWFGLTA